MKVEEEQTNERYSMRERRKPMVFSPRHESCKHSDSDSLLKYSVLSKKGFKELRSSAEFGLKSAWKLSHILAKLCKSLGLSSHHRYQAVYFEEASQSKSYSEWKKLRNAESLLAQRKVKVRLYKLPKPPKSEQNKPRQLATRDPRPDVSFHQLNYLLTWCWMLIYCTARNQPPS